MFEKLLIEYCSPMLACLKLANLFSVVHCSDQELIRQIGYWNERMEAKGITLTLLKRKNGRALVYACRKKLLEEHLKSEEISNFLSRYGYASLNADYAIERLKKRMEESDEFPHEIGVFLDYPIGDVEGFIQNAGRGYKCAGCWKVYCDECEARKKFEQFRKCREVYMNLWRAGESIEHLAVTA